MRQKIKKVQIVLFRGSLQVKHLGIMLNPHSHPSLFQLHNLIEPIPASSGEGNVNLDKSPVGNSANHCNTVPQLHIHYKHKLE